MEKKRILFVSQEIFPFLPKSEISHNARKLPQGTQENGKEIRVFTPRFGSINERRHQLHEVIRLSGMNIIIDDHDHPLIIKVASIPAARIQVYFIDNDEFFKRKNNVTQEDGSDYPDNDERSMFFCRGVLETVKKLGWKPDVIHCHGWMTSLMPMYIKKMYNKDPHFADTKVVYSIYDTNEGFKQAWDPRFADKLAFDGFDEEVTTLVKNPTMEAITNAAVAFSDGVIQSSMEISPELTTVFDNATCMKLNYLPEENLTKGLNEFFDKVLEEGALV
ncbi:MAG: glycogen/starch synthase [Fluviicola sp.]|jgi:starch synthase|nr:glycogen/starch synthase [Fluviicola sp.]MBP6271962.1 glycogen/starch synthase [Fluviicola sp.]